MEDIQKKQNEYVTPEEFNKLNFGVSGDIPKLIMDFISILSGVSHDYLIKVLT